MTPQESHPDQPGAATAAVLHRVVVGVDGSELAAAALRWVAQRVAPEGTVHAVHAIRPGTELTLAAFQIDWGELRQQAREDLAGAWAEPARAAGVEPVTHVIDDDPARALLAVADREDATAIVVGVHGLGGRRLPLVGSVTRRVLHRSTRPVIVVNEAAGDSPAAGAAPAAPTGSGPVVAGVGYGEASDQALAWAAAYAASRGLHLHLLHAISSRPMVPLDSPSDTLASYLGSDVDLEWAADDLAGVRDEVLDRYPELIVVSRVERGSAVAMLTDAGRQGAELVVAGKRHSRALARLTISPRLRQLIVGAAGPTMIVPSCADLPR